MIAGRALETSATTVLLDELESGPAALVLSGDAGIGKTVLWDAAARRSRERGHRVLLARPVEAESRLSYACLADLLADVEDEVFDLLPTPQRAAVDTVLLRRRAGGPSVDHRAVGAAVRTVLERLARDAPVLLAVDDLQWADVSSRRAVTFATRRTDARVGVLATVRTGPVEDTPPQVQVRPPAEVRHVRVPALGADELHEIIAERTGRSLSRPVLSRIMQVSGGNPFFALELARAGPDGLPDGSVLPETLDRLVRRRLDGLDADVRTALLAAAMSAEPSVAFVGRAIGTPTADATVRLERAERAGVVVLDGSRVRFTHPLLAAGAYSIAPAGDRRACHRHLAGIVEDPEARARHLAFATVDGDPEAVRALDDAARTARERGAPSAAADLLELAVALGGDTAGRRLLQARHHLDAGDPAAARRILDALLPGLGPGRERADALRTMAIQRLHDDSFREAARLLQRALAEGVEDRRLCGDIRAHLTFVLVHLGETTEALAVVDRAVADAEATGDPGLLVPVLGAAAMTGFLGGRGLDRGGLQRATDLESELVNAPMMFRPALIDGMLHAWTGDFEQAREHFSRVRRHSVDRGEETDLVYPAFHQVVLECWLGDRPEAARLAADATSRAGHLGTDMATGLAQSASAMVDAFGGREHESRRAARQAIGLFRAAECHAFAVWPAITLVFLETSLGNHQAAVEMAGWLDRAPTRMGIGTRTAAPFAPFAIESLVALGRLGEARPLVEAIEAEGRSPDRAWARAVGARCRALLLAADGDLAGGEAVADLAVTGSDASVPPFERARALLVLGGIRRRRRQKRAAATALRESADLFTGLGAAPWAVRARSELRRVAPRAPSDDVSSTERRVAELVATGMTNREVAAALFVSPKTVEAHLSRAYRKLGVRSRSELRHVLRTGGATT